MLFQHQGWGAGQGGDSGGWIRWPWEPGIWQREQFSEAWPCRVAEQGRWRAESQVERGARTGAVPAARSGRVLLARGCQPPGPCPAFIKFYWNIAVPVGLGVVCGWLCAARAESSGWDRGRRPTELQCVRRGPSLGASAGARPWGRPEWGPRAVCSERVRCSASFSSFSLCFSLLYSIVTFLDRLLSLCYMHFKKLRYN